MKNTQYVINRHNGSVCYRSDVLFAEYMYLGPKAPHNWLIVHLRNGGTLESELLKNEPKLEELMTRMYCDGIRIIKTTCAQVLDG